MSLMWKSDEIKDLAEALRKFQSETSGVTKTSKAGGGSFSYNYADLGSIWASIHGPLAMCGLAVSQMLTPEGVRTMLMHVSGQWISGTCPLTMDPGGRIKGSQAMGSSITYSRRYGLLAILSLPTLDDDGAEASKPSNRKVAAPKKAPSKQRSKTANPELVSEINTVMKQIDLLSPEDVDAFMIRAEKWLATLPEHDYEVLQQLAEERKAA